MKMKKYLTPEMEVIEVKVQNALLAISDGGGSSFDPNEESTPGEEGKTY